MHNQHLDISCRKINKQHNRFQFNILRDATRNNKMQNQQTTSYSCNTVALDRYA